MTRKMITWRDEVAVRQARCLRHRFGSFLSFLAILLACLAFGSIVGLAR